MRVDNMLVHPWIELQESIKEKWLTQKAFSLILWKKVSEVNELLKWKRNITIQRDYLLHKTLWTPIKYWILKQIDYEYSLIDFNENNIENEDIWYISQKTENKEDINIKTDNYSSQNINHSNNSNTYETNWDLLIKNNKTEEIINTDSEINTEINKNNEEDRQRRIKIFKSF